MRANNNYHKWIFKVVLQICAISCGTQTCLSAQSKQATVLENFLTSKRDNDDDNNDYDDDNNDNDDNNDKDDNNDFSDKHAVFMPSWNLLFTIHACVFIYLC